MKIETESESAWQLSIAAVSGILARASRLLRKKPQKPRRLPCAATKRARDLIAVARHGNAELFSLQGLAPIKTADETAKHFGISLAFADPFKMIQHPDVDLVSILRARAFSPSDGDGRFECRQASLLRMAACGHYRAGSADA